MKHAAWPTKAPPVCTAFWDQKAWNNFAEGFRPEWYTGDIFDYEAYETLRAERAEKERVKLWNKLAGVILLCLVGCGSTHPIDDIQRQHKENLQLCLNSMKENELSCRRESRPDCVAFAKKSLEICVESEIENIDRYFRYIK